jgi:ABC-type glycerol-3-phosphate transport system permease component
MESALISLFSVALLIITTVTMMVTSMQSAADISEAWQNINGQIEETLQTSIDVNLPTDYYGGNLLLQVLNVGQKSLSAFADWDIIVEYGDGTANYINYTELDTPGYNEWTINSIYVTSSGVGEVFDPGILNPEEHMVIKINIYPEISSGETIRVTVSTPGGITSQCMITRIEPV